MLVPCLALVTCVVAGLVAGCGGGAAPNSVKYTPTSTVSLSVDPPASASASATGGASSSASASSTPTDTPTGLRGTDLPAGVPTIGQNVRPGATVPILDPIAQTDNLTGAIFFANYWELVVDWSIQTVDSTLARTLFSTTCARCENFFGQVDMAKQAGNAFIGGRISLIGAQEGVNNGRYGATEAIGVTVATEALEVRSPNGTVLESDPAMPSVLYGVWLAWSGRGWTVVDWGHK